MERFSRQTGWLIQRLMFACAMFLELVLAGCGFPTSSTANAPTATLFPAGVRTNVAYGPLAAEKLDVCDPKAGIGLHPGVILIHGGGWSAGDKSAFEAVCTYIASQGFVATTVDYRLGPTYHWPAQVVDVQLAVRWMRANASALGLDPTRLCSYGSSAGGHLAVFLGVLHTTHAGDEASLYADQSPSATCVVDEFGPVDLTHLAGSNATPTPCSSKRSMPSSAAQRHRIPAMPVSVLERVRVDLNTFIERITPAMRAAYLLDVSSQSAPTLIVQGTQDTTVPPTQSQELQTALQQAGVSVQYIPYSGGHGFSGLSAQQVRAIELQAVGFLTTQEYPE